MDASKPRSHEISDASLVAKEQSVENCVELPCRASSVEAGLSKAVDVYVVLLSL